MADEKQRIIEFDETSHINADDHVLIDGATAGTRSLKISDLPGGGSSGVQDVLVDNVSVVDNDIANIDLSGKQDALTAGSNITIDNNVISAEDTTYSAGDNVSISAQNVISATDTTYSAGTNVSISAQNEISATDTTYTAGANIQISNKNVISATDTTYSAFDGDDPGLVPSSTSSTQSKFLRGDGTWQAVSGLPDSYAQFTQQLETGYFVPNYNQNHIKLDKNLSLQLFGGGTNFYTANNEDSLTINALSNQLTEGADIWKAGYWAAHIGDSAPAGADQSLNETLINIFDMIDSAGGSDVSVTQIQSAGTNIATITVDDVDTDIYAPNDSVTQTEVNSGGYEILLSNQAEGDVKKNSGLYYNIDDSIYGGQLVGVKSPEGNNNPPNLILWDEVDHNAGYGDIMQFTPTDIRLSSMTAQQVHAATWDGTNESLRSAFSSMWLSGSTTPLPSQGRNGSIYYKTNAAGDAVINVYVKLNNTWLPYQLPTPTPPSAETLLYSWDFRESMIDSVEGRENLIGGGIETYDYISELITRDDTKGLVGHECYGTAGPAAQIPVDLRLPGYKVEIEFGDYEMEYSDYTSSLIGTYSDPESWEEGEHDGMEIHFLYYNGLEINCQPIAAGYVASGSQVVNTNDPSYFANSKVTIKTIAPTTEPDLRILDPADYQYSNEYLSYNHTYNVLWEVYKDDVLVGTTPQVYVGEDLYGISGIPPVNSAQLATMGYWTPDPQGYHSAISFCIPAACATAIEIKTLKIYRINSQS